MSALPPGKLPEVPVPAQTSRPGGIGSKVENTLLRFWALALNNARQALSAVLGFGLELFMDAIKPVLRIAFAPLLRTLIAEPDCPSELRTLIETTITAEGEGGAALLGMVGTSLAGGLFGSLSGAIFGGWTRYANMKKRPLRADLPMEQAMLRRGSISEEQYKIGLAEIGWTEQLASAIWQITQPRPDIGTLTTDLFRRGVPLDALKGEIVRRGYDPADADKIINVLTPIPGPGDLVRMAVREAFTPAAVERYGLKQDFPGAFGEWMKKLGYSDDWAKAFWAAHWELPSATMGMEMLHRGIIDSGDFSLLLRVLDISPYWRPKIEQMSYSPYTRVDVRRMYQVGVITTGAELIRAYKDLGYDDVKANNLATFTILEYGETEREATKSEVLQAYEIGRLSKAEAATHLRDMGYPEWVIAMYLARVEMAQTNKLASTTVASVKTLYVNGQYDESAVYVALNKVPLPASEIARYLQEWEVPKITKTARPTRAELRAIFLANKMSEGDFRTELSGYRLSAKYIEWYIAMAKDALVAAAQKNLEDTRAAAEKVRTAVVKSAFDIESAKIDVEIATVNLAMADLRISASPDMTDEQLARIGALITQAGRQIKALQLEKAEQKMSYLEKKGAG